MNIKKIKAVVIDCDGVMFDTALANRKFYDEILERFGKPALDDEQFVNVHMMTVTEAIGYLFPEKDDLSEVYQCLKTIGYHKFIKYMKMETGLKTLVPVSEPASRSRIWVQSALHSPKRFQERIKKDC